MWFDPYDCQELTERIEWALETRAMLLSRQRLLYDQLARRTWRRVVDDHIEILECIAAQDGGAAAKT